MNIDGVIKDQDEEVLQEHIPVVPVVWGGFKGSFRVVLSPTYQSFWCWGPPWSSQNRHPLTSPPLFPLVRGWNICFSLEIELEFPFI